MTEKIYLQYADILSQTAILEFQLNEKKRALEEMKDELDKDKFTDGGFGLELSAHAFTNISSRLSALAVENIVIYKDVMNSENQADSLIWPSNMKAFVIGMIANARQKKEFEIKDSKNRDGGKEFHYEIEIKTWSNSKSALVFIAIVESNVIKTGYFNWIDKKQKG